MTNSPGDGLSHSVVRSSSSFLVAGSSETFSQLELT